MVALSLVLKETINLFSIVVIPAYNPINNI
jgi:hypothetical protein